MITTFYGRNDKSSLDGTNRGVFHLFWKQWQEHILGTSHPWKLQVLLSALFYVLSMHQHFTGVLQWIRNCSCLYSTHLQPHVLDKDRGGVKKMALLAKFSPWFQWEYFCLSHTTDNLDVTPSLTVHHTCFNHYIVYEFVLKGGGSFVQVLFGRILSFFEIIKYFSIPGSVYGFDNCHLTVYWDPLELRLLREVY